MSTAELLDGYAVNFDGYAYAIEAWGISVEDLLMMARQQSRATRGWPVGFERLRCVLFGMAREHHFLASSPGEVPEGLTDLYASLRTSWKAGAFEKPLEIASEFS